MLNFVRLIRVHQYIKNLFIFLPLFFSGQFSESIYLLNAFYAFIAFSLCASAVYILNDYRDIEDDKSHPRKKFRPLASGAVKPNAGLSIMVLLLFSGLGLLSTISLDAMYIVLGYVLLNIAYSFKLKHIAILDVVIIATGFVLRLFVGSAVTGIQLSMWIVIMTFLLALFLALAKRRDDVLIFNSSGKKMRKVIDGYNLPFIDGAMMIMASVVIVSYILYTTSVDVISRLHSDYIYLTALFVIVGIMRYLQLTYVEENSGSPTKIVLKDTFIQVTILGWAAMFGWIIY
jgi:4-hydroxybenzoate polyprenyltransferase